MTSIRRLAVLMAACLPCLSSVCWAGSAEQIIAQTGVQGGLIVHLGCGDGAMTAALGAGDGFLVHGLDVDPRNVAAAREHVKSLGLYGKVSVDTLRGERLPYVDNLVNLVVSEDLSGVFLREVMRVLRPGGVAHIKGGGAWETTVKPWPEGIDDWTHFLHGPDNNAVGHDSVVDVPRRLQWLGRPKFARAHEQLASLGACVTTGGRLFYVVDKAPPADVRFPSQWFLVARDAFNGVVLWERSAPTWVNQLRRFRSGPPDTAFRLAAKDDLVYVTLGVDAPVSILDAATGRTLATCPQTGNARQILRLFDKLVVLVDTAPQTTEEDDSRIRRGLKAAPGRRAIVAAPQDRRTFVNGQLESVWPVYGSVLVHGDKLVIAAGRSSYLDGGIRVYLLDPETGQALSETVMYSPDPETGKQPEDENVKDVRGALSDILVADAGGVYMRHVKLDFNTGSQTGKGVHLFSPIGLLDDTWWHRAYWVVGDEFIAHWSGWWKIGNVVPAGRILSYDETSVFGYGRDQYHGGNTGQWRGGEKYQLFACDRPAPGQEPTQVETTPAEKRPPNTGKGSSQPVPPSRTSRWVSVHFENWSFVKCRNRVAFRHDDFRTRRTTPATRRADQGTGRADQGT